MDSKMIQSYVDRVWDDSIVPALSDYIRIPCKSPAFDPEWEKNGHMGAAIELISAWCQEHAPEGLTLEVVRLPGRTPVIYMEVPGEGGETTLLYGHLDKQPEMTGWDDDKDPWKPVLQDGRLYGRGGADDGYAAFAAITAINALREANERHGRCVILIEACEESGSYDLPAYIEHLADRIGDLGLIVCLDSGAGNYEQLWSTTSLRGMIAGSLHVELIHEGVHSGDASGIVPSSFRVARMLLSRLEDEDTGVILPTDFHVDIPVARQSQAAQAALVLDEVTYTQYPFHEGVKPVSGVLVELVLNRTWRPALAVTGAGGLPALKDAGNVMRPITSLRLSLRLPPTADAEKASQRLKEILEADPPYGARVRFEIDHPGQGWEAPALAPWLESSVNEASEVFYGKPAVYMGEGGSIPFMGLLGEKFPRAQFLITGVLGPGSNAHGPNEFIDVEYAKKLTACVAKVLADHHSA